MKEADVKKILEKWRMPLAITDCGLAAKEICQLFQEPMPEPCPKCSGDGGYHSTLGTNTSWINCLTCKGTGIKPKPELILECCGKPEGERKVERIPITGVPCTDVVTSENWKKTPQLIHECGCIGECTCEVETDKAIERLKATKKIKDEQIKPLPWEKWTEPSPSAGKVGLRQKLIDWIYSYKDIAERNALAETPEESADYLISLIGCKDCAVKEYGEGYTDGVRYGQERKAKIASDEGLIKDIEEVLIKYKNSLHKKLFDKGIFKSVANIDFRNFAAREILSLVSAHYKGRVKPASDQTWPMVSGTAVMLVAKAQGWRKVEVENDH